MTFKLSHRVRCAAAALATAVLAANPAAAQPAVPKETPAQLIERAKAAIAGGDLAGGENLLSGVEVSPATVNDVDFLRGTVAFARRDYDEAIARFTAVLRRDPAANRVRLDLARAYFMKGDDKAAEFHFRAAAAQKGVPEPVLKSIDIFLDAIRRRKKWQFTFQGAVVPDTNINAATAASSIDVLGLPFELSDNARKTSGVGLSLNLGVERQWDVAANTKLRTGAAYNGTEYTRQEFTDRQIGAYVGPRFLLSQDTEMSVLGTASRRWYGNVPLNYGAGGRIEIRTTLSPRFLLDGAFVAQEFEYNEARYGAYTGPVLGASGALTYAIDTSSFLRGSLGVTREQTDYEPFRDFQYSTGLGYYRENLPYRFAVYASVQSTFSRYDAQLPLFGLTRHDTQMSYRLSLSNKYIDIYGFTPVISYVHDDRYSNISIYAFHRDHGEIGVTRNF